MATAATNFAYFYFYFALMRRVAGDAGVPVSPLTTLGASALAAMLAQITVMPITSAASAQQTSPELARRPLIAVLVTLLHRGGFGALYAGLGPSLALSSNPVFTYAAYGALKPRLAATVLSRRLTRRTNVFVLGAASKCAATVLTYPLIVAKACLQASSASGRDEHGTLSLLRLVYRKRGICGWYQGLETQLLKAVLTQAIMMTAKDALDTRAAALVDFGSTLITQSATLAKN